jgi:hypothetical protein
MRRNGMEFKYKGEPVILEFNEDGTLRWVYAYNMRMCFNILPHDLKLEVAYILQKENK